MPDGTPPPPDPYTPVDYPAHYPQLPPPVYPSPYPQPTDYGYPPPSYGYPPPGYAGPAGYAADPYDPYRPTRPVGTNGKAIASLVCSVAGLLCCAPAIAGLILGIIAMRETKRTGQDGNGLAIAGVVVGALAIAGYIVYFLFMLGLGIATAPDYPT
ncbi:DUF4190 domain-containing protein [Mycolicibacterium sphagni]|uniref:DUF4190 domain-containing protein n=1 Tax=Mycolicibacterium sphagni TaxID=1786 RepID=A0ABX2JVZ0_9MYCO|nr:DUF4190 domain-containing protein [Mycolicibacterium sphagni]NTY59969.1 DUF4190 domain-containing protein [Mycolicibacterium sphagni]